GSEIQPVERPPLFILDKPNSQKIWRYLEFEHFVDLLSTRTLYFSRVDRVGDDPLEGLITDATFEALSREIPWENDAAKNHFIETFKKSIIDLTFNIHYAEVQYITETDVIPINNIQIPFGYKRKSFEYEKEFRAVHLENPEPRNNTIDFSIPNPKDGVRIPADINRLINLVYIFP